MVQNTRKAEIAKQKTSRKYALQRSVQPLDFELGEEIRKRRVAAGYTKKALAEILGISSQQLQKYEIGVNRISVSRLVDICDILNISPETLLSKITNSEESNTISAANEMVNRNKLLKTELGQQVLASLSQVNDEDILRKLIAALEDFKEHSAKSYKTKQQDKQQVRQLHG